MARAGARRRAEPGRPRPAPASRAWSSRSDAIGPDRQRKEDKQKADSCDVGRIDETWRETGVGEATDERDIRDSHHELERAPELVREPGRLQHEPTGAQLLNQVTGF